MDISTRVFPAGTPEGDAIRSAVPTTYSPPVVTMTTMTTAGPAA